MTCGQFHSRLPLALEGPSLGPWLFCSGGDGCTDESLVEFVELNCDGFASSACAMFATKRRGDTLRMWWWWWRLSVVLLALLTSQFGGGSACTLDDCSRSAETYVPREFEFWRAFQAHQVGNLFTLQNEASRTYLVAANLTWSEANGGDVGGVEWTYAVNGSYRTIPQNGTFGDEVQLGRLDWLRLQVDNGSAVGALESVLLQLMSVYAVADGNCSCVLHELSFSILSQHSPIEVADQIEVLPSTFSSVASLLSFGTSSAKSAKVRHSNTSRGQVNISTSAELTLFDIEHFGIAVLAVSASAGSWNVGYPGSGNADILLYPGDLDPPVLLGPDAALGFVATLRIEEMCSGVLPNVSFIPWQLGHGLDLEQPVSVVVIRAVDLGCVPDETETVNGSQPGRRLSTKPTEPAVNANAADVQPTDGSMSTPDVSTKGTSVSASPSDAPSLDNSTTPDMTGDANHSTALPTYTATKAQPFAAFPVTAKSDHLNVPTAYPRSATEVPPVTETAPPDLVSSASVPAVPDGVTNPAQGKHSSTHRSNVVGGSAVKMAPPEGQATDAPRMAVTETNGQKTDISPRTDPSGQTTDYVSLSSTATPETAAPIENGTGSSTVPKSIVPAITGSRAQVTHTSAMPQDSGATSAVPAGPTNAAAAGVTALPSPAVPSATTPPPAATTTQPPTSDPGRPAYHCSRPPSPDLPGCTFADGFLVPSVLTASPSIAIVLPGRFTAAIRTYWSGWRGDIINYHFAYYPMRVDKASNKLTLTAGPIFELAFYSPPRDAFTVHLQQGIYSFVLRVLTAGNHTQLARQLVLVADYSAAQLHTVASSPLRITSLDQPPWKSSRTTIDFSWHGHFANSFISRHSHYLLAVEGIPGLLDKYDQTFGQLSIHGTTNLRGVTSFHYVVCAIKGDIQRCKSGRPDPRLAQSVSLDLPEMLITGAVLHVTIYAGGVLGASVSSSVSAYVDLTPPAVHGVRLLSGASGALLSNGQSLTAVERSGSGRQVLLLVVSAADEESGVESIAVTASGGNDGGGGGDPVVSVDLPMAFNAVSEAVCRSELHCSCPLDGASCQLYLTKATIELPALETTATTPSDNQTTPGEMAPAATEDWWNMSSDANTTSSSVPPTTSATPTSPFQVSLSMTIHNRAGLVLRDTLNVTIDTLEAHHFQLPVIVASHTSKSITVTINQTALQTVLLIRSANDVAERTTPDRPRFVVMLCGVSEGLISASCRHHAMPARGRITLAGLQEHELYAAQVVQTIGLRYSTIHMIATQEDVPSSAPQHVAADSIDGVTATLSWQPPPADDQNGVVLMYTLYLGVAAGHATDLEIVSDHVLSNDTELVWTYSDLIPGQLYYFSVSASTVVGEGPRTKGLSFRTNASAPAGFPWNLRLTGSTSTSVSVTWAAVPAVECNGAITRYELVLQSQQRFDHPSSKKHVAATAQTFQKTFGDLQPFQRYRVRIRAATSAGFGPFSPAVVVETREGSPVAPGLATMVTGVTSVFLSWHWTGELSRGVLTTQQVRYRGATDPTYLELSVPAGTWNANVTNLQAHTTVEFQLRGATASGWGEYGSPVRVQLPTSDGSTIQLLTLISASNSSLFFTWSRPMHNSSSPAPNPTPAYIVTYYSVLSNCRQEGHAVRSDPCQNSSPVTISIHGNRAFLVGLTAMTFYNISVQLGAGVQGSRQVTYAIHRTLPSPLLVSGLKLVSRTSHSLTVQWQLNVDAQQLLRQASVQMLVRAMSSNSSFAQRRQIVNSSVTDMTRKLVTWTVADLQGDTLYEVAVKTDNDSTGPSSVSAPTVVTSTLPSVPSAPTAAAVINVPGYGLQVEWQEAKFQQSQVSGYRVAMFWGTPSAVESEHTAASQLHHATSLAFHHRQVHRLYSPSQRMLTVTDPPANSSVFVMVSSWCTDSAGQPLDGESTAAGGLVTSNEESPLRVLSIGTSGGGNGLNVTWEDRGTPALQQDNSSLFYIVRAMLYGQCDDLVSDISPLKMHEVHIDSTDYSQLLDMEFDDLRAYSKYTIEVSRIIDNVDQFGMAHYHYLTANTVLACTGEAAPSSSVQSLQAAAVTSRQMRLSWSPVEYGDLNGYMLEYLVTFHVVPDGQADARARRSLSKSPGTELRNVSVHRRVNTAVLTGLLPDAQYAVNVFAQTESGSSPTARVVVETLEDDPEIRWLKILYVNSSSISIEWLQYPNSKLVKLQALLTPVTTATAGHSVPARASDIDHSGNSMPRHYQHVWSDLRAMTRYRVVVALTTLFGKTNSSIEIATHESVPSRAPRLHCQSHSVNTQSIVNLTWSPIPNDHQNGRLVGYVVRYHKTNDSTVGSVLNASAGDNDILMDSLTDPGLYSFTIAGVTAAGIGVVSPPCRVPLNDSNLHGDNGLGIRRRGIPYWMYMSIALIPVLIIVLLVTIVLVRQRKGLDWRARRKNTYVSATASNLIPMHTYSMYQTCRGLTEEKPDHSELFQQLASYPTLQVERHRLRQQKSMGVGNLITMYIAKMSQTGPVERSSPQSKVDVIVKQLHRTTEGEGAAQMHLEIEALRTFQHKNIVEMVGLCTADVPQLIILENMAKGDLKAFLTSCRSTPALPCQLSLTQQLYIVYQASCAVQYLAKHCFVHGDIAARNYLVGANMEVKLADFGLNQGLYCEDYYSSGPGTPVIPLRWMSPEALFEGQFTTSSDIWSLGVLMWEVFTLGQQPYPDHTNIELLFKLRDHFYPTQPLRCPQYVFDLMVTCWTVPGNTRPGVDTLVKAVLHFIATQAPRKASNTSASDDLILLYGQLNELIDDLDDIGSESRPPPPPQAKSTAVYRRGSCPNPTHIYSEPDKSHMYEDIVMGNPAALPPRRRPHSMQPPGQESQEGMYLTSVDSLESLKQFQLQSITTDV